MTILAKLGEQIKQLRLDKGLNQKQLAEAVGVTKASISDYERNKRYPPYNVLQAIGETLDVPVTELFAYMAEKENDDKNIPMEYPVYNEYAKMLPKVIAALNKLSDDAWVIAIQRLEELSMIPMYQRTLANVLRHYIFKRYHLTYEILKDTGLQDICRTNTQSKNWKLPYEVQHIILQREISSNVKKIWEFFYYSFVETIADDFDIMRILDNPVVKEEPGHNLGFIFDDDSMFYKFYNRYVEYNTNQNTQALFLCVEKDSWEIKDLKEYDPNI